MIGTYDRTTEIVQDVLSRFAENSKYTLADNLRFVLPCPFPARMTNSGCSSEQDCNQPHVLYWDTKRKLKADSFKQRFPEEQRLGVANRIHPPETRLRDLHTNTVASASFRRSPLSSGKHNNLRRTTSGAVKTDMSPPADVDDTAAFMAAVRNRRHQALSGQSDSIMPSVEEVEHVETPMEVSIEAPVISEPSPSKKKENVKPAQTSTPGTPVLSAKEDKHAPSFSASAGLEASKWADPRYVSPTRSQKTLRARGSSISIVTPQPRAPEVVAPTKEAQIIVTSEAPKASVAEEEDRENLTHFKTWGAPLARDKPASQVRRVILSNLPSTYNAPAKVLTLVHGGAIENIRLTTTGSAHILFCEASACKAYYDQYPNGIAVGPGGRQTIFVDMGTEVDVVSSQLALALTTGATRVIRCAGVEMGISMATLFEMASASNRKVEKIIDSYITGESRVVIFRFCSMEDAIRFKSALVRNDDWEQCNIQYGEDPCDLATGPHYD
ncbi:hypothetical protein ANI_1_3316024 [Paecilomyces variotii No. 5]|uniref:Uncharacterized protein n=1 Tax=Byssochlamys spectabilis (strain No. 5 / NBRC 109023) TaxID=1356009 RepID=V5G1P7_BYSSN|nr:hypothetical protein ANI_1_3316024 [Paecilomyces variotii No. 5]